ncbi:response regulator transcription factor [Evansella cellulosilytica]|uniref:Two component transcriptional regulator, winged helix family n=1 Tax=Evansella cellulosilytica (strain ATCC 21833 / DSM 2522 / FERM P-1141 / JCM 9156 / N-4) TaxID=649639 RepID=E6TYF8_EVAC2|nr:response regulator transcription factor [Evansella cellulosilytica]ADU28896.1 two component transcriptional regulator, winged helix family [Evansella cellulosilytica DSM 2522]
MYKVLIIEDDETISSIMEENLRKWGFSSFRINDFREVLTEYTAIQPHLVLMDINLPFYDGFYWCTKIRELSTVPIIFISSRDTDADKIRAISQGGDDYIDKPFSIDLLIAKIQATLRRTYSYSDQQLNVLQYDNLVFHIEKQVVFCGDSEILLTKNESRILAVLIRNRGNVVSRTRLMKALWDDESFVDENTLTVNVNRLRKKLASLPSDDDFIKTVKGEGYRLL